MADECTDIATIQWSSMYYHWIENGAPIEHFMEMLSLEKRKC